MVENIKISVNILPFGQMKLMLSSVEEKFGKRKYQFMLSPNRQI